VRRPRSLRHRRAVAALVRLREAAGLKMGEAAEICGWEIAKISKIEGLKQGITGDDAYALCQAYGADADTTEALVQLARQSRVRGWWQVYSDDVLGNLGDVLELESDAVKIQTLTIDLVPGLLQTRDYARALILAAQPTLDRADVEKQVDLRMERQKQVWENGKLLLQAVIVESALMVPVGGRSVMAHQLSTLAEQAERSNVTIQVLPADGAHAGMGEPFVVLYLADGGIFGSVDTPSGSAYVEERRDTERYMDLWTNSQVRALGYDQSRERIQQWASHWSNGQE
jgi:transcriptional regulator with XRE-family HTH domain